MISRICLVLAGCLLASCSTTPPQPTSTPSPASAPSNWHGRLALRTLSEPPRAFGAAFELQGSAQTGELTFFTPLGSTAAVLRWTTQSAQLQRAGQVQNFDSLDELVAHTLDTPIPVPALFAWLAG